MARGNRTTISVQRAGRHPYPIEINAEGADTLEKHYKDMQDIEFTVEQGELFMLQTRTGKRTAAAAVQIACDMVEEGLTDSREAVRRFAPKQTESLLHSHLSQAVPGRVPCSPPARTASSCGPRRAPRTSPA
jgi:pyruvate,orthophosphate dikinase